MSIDTYHRIGIHLYCDHGDLPEPIPEPLSRGPEPAADEPEQDAGTRDRGRPVKTEAFKDLLSTGRKRAAKLYAIQPGQICEWAWKKNCGGGVKPVTGCTGRAATNIHHGPDKSVLNNRPDNVSVICAFCHNEWHAKNDQYYEGLRPVDGAAWLPVEEYEPLSTAVKVKDKMEIVTFEVSSGRRVESSLVAELQENYNLDKQ